MLAFILAKVDAGKDREVFDEVKKMKEAKRAFASYGVYDLLIEVELETPEKLDALIFDKIRKIPGVKETVTIVTLRSIV